MWLHCRIGMIGKYYSAFLSEKARANRDRCLPRTLKVLHWNNYDILQTSLSFEIETHEWFHGHMSNPISTLDLCGKRLVTSSSTACSWATLELGQNFLSKHFFHLLIYILVHNMFLRWKNKTSHFWGKLGRKCWKMLDKLEVIWDNLMKWSFLFSKQIENKWKKNTVNPH